ncbi:MAG: CPBP family intramembrane metalloprotease [Chloroflexi bacterium]|nr:CPBP family intramembrane metalloprotease [Chloroflexota bacterium]
MARTNVPWGVKEVFSGVVIAGAAVIAMLLFTSLAAGLPGTRYELEGRDALLVSIGFELFFALVAFWFAVVRRRGSLANLGFVRPTGNHPYVIAAVGWVLGLAATFAWVAIAREMGWERFTPSDEARKVTDSGVSLWLALFVVGAVAPFAEEIFFRGFAYAGVRRELGIALGVVASAALFALFHVDPTVFVPTFIFGIVLAWVYIQTGSIWPAMFAHALNNAVALLVAVGT